MALATKFRVQGTSDVFGQITVNIQLNDYAGSIIDLDGAGRDWIRLKIGDNSSEMSSPILAGKLTFSFYVTDDFQTTEIGKSEVYTYYVEVLDENLDQIWAGWAMPEEYTEAYHNTPYVATVVASDGLQELKNVSYPLQDGKATLFTHLQNCLISTFVNNNIFESVNIYSNGMNSTASDSPFKQAQVTYNSFRSISETPKAYEVLSSLLVPFFARIYQYRGWRIENILEKRSSYVVREYDITGTFVGQSTFNPLVKFDTNYGTFKAFIQKSGQLSIRPALNNAEVYFNTVEPVEPTTTGGFQDADDWVSTTELDKWTVVAGGGANQISIEQVPSSFDGNEFAVKIPGRKTSLELTDYIESDPVNIATADYESINVDFAHYANYPSVVLLGSKPILYFEIVFTETSSGDVYNWSGSEWVLIPLGQPRKRLRIDFNDRMKWRRYSAVIDRVPSTGNIKFRFYKLIKSGTTGVTELRLTAWKTNLIVSQPTNAALLLEAGTTNIFTQYKGPSFPHIISDGTVLNAAGVMDVANTLTATWARRGVTESLNIRRLFLTQWLSFNSRPTEILSGVIHQKGELITPMSVVKDKDAVSSTRYVMQSYEISLGTGIGSASYREIVMEDANINAFQEFLDSIRLGDFFAATVNYNIFIGGAPGLSPGANPNQIDLNFNLNGDVKGGLNQAEITPAAIQNKARLDTTGLTANDIVIGAVKDSPDQENMTNLRLSDLSSFISGSNWTLVGSDIYRNSAVAIGRTTIPTNATFAVQSLTATDNNEFIQLQNNAGTNLFALRQSGLGYFSTPSFSFGTSTITNNQLRHRAGWSGNAGVQFLIEDSSQVLAFSVDNIGRVVTRNRITIQGEGISINGASLNSANNTGIALKGTNDGLDCFRITTETDFLAVRYRRTLGFELYAFDNSTAYGLSVFNSSSTRLFSVQGNGSININDAGNIVLGTTTGTKIGTATNQRLAFYNSTPIVQPSGNILTALTNLGLVASPTISPFNLTQEGATDGQVLAWSNANSRYQPTTPSGGGISTVVLASDVINNNAVANTMQNVTGLSFTVISGRSYWFKFIIRYTAAATTTGSRWGVNASAGTAAELSLTSEYSLTTTTTTRNALIQAFDSPAASNATSATTGNNMAIIEGHFVANANGTFIARFASEVANSAITAKAGSVCYFQQLN